ncbi:MAG TPA: iron-containing alcohol dehydrogenase [Thermodesulfobacteriota bacterium]|nr:iron-containing alcohol dehydrogenase [Thermodesulfobacteriota bacterium]
MKENIERAKKILKDWKGDNYSFGEGVLDATGKYGRKYGKKASLVVTELGQAWIEKPLEQVKASLKSNQVTFELVNGARPNAPREDVYRISHQVARSKSDLIVALGGGSTIDAAKAAALLNTYSPSEVREVLGASTGDADSIEPYFGVGIVTKIKEKTGRPVMPVVAVETASSSGAHLTKYSNITDLVSGQKKLIVDEAIVPPSSVFDYGVTLDSPMSLTLDGGLDGIAHAWEVFTGTSGQAFEKVKDVAELCIRLVVYGLQRVKKDKRDMEGRIALGLGTDLGGYSIMLGGTGGPHLGSFSLIDILSHGRACALLNPYYTVLFAPVVQGQLKIAADVFKGAGYISEDVKKLSGRDLGLAVAKGMIAFAKDLNFPITLKEAGATREHIDRMLLAAKNPQLKMKLQNMPTPMDAEKGDVDRLMKPVLEAAYTGDLSLIP